MAAKPSGYFRFK